MRSMVGVSPPEDEIRVAVPATDVTKVLLEMSAERMVCHDGSFPSLRTYLPAAPMPSLILFPAPSRVRRSPLVVNGTDPPTITVVLLMIVAVAWLSPSSVTNRLVMDGCPSF